MNTSPQSLVSSISATDLANVVQKRGYRALCEGTPEAPVLHSAASGLNYQIRMHTPSPAGDATWRDWTYLLAIRIEAPFDEAFIAEWNRSRRFARLTRSDDQLVLAMDVNIIGGVSQDYLTGQCAVWERLVQELVDALRREGKKHELERLASNG